MNSVDLVIGETILVELEGECVVGVLTHVSAGRTFIRLSNVRDVITNIQRGRQDYYSSEVRNIRNLERAADGTHANNSVHTGNSARTGTKPTLNTNQLSIHSLDAALAKIQKCVFINQTDAKYHDIMKYLRNQREFGISMECIGNARHAMSPSLLSVVTSRWIFIFDVKWIKITQAVGDLLSENNYRRVIYNGRLMKDVLMHCFGIVLGKCFDAMVAHIALSKAKEEGNSMEATQMSIQYLVEEYFKLPEMFFNKDVDFDERPLKDESKLEAAKKVAFLLDLQDHIVHEIMLKKFYDSCEAYADSLAQNPDFIDSMVVMRHGRNEAAQAIDPFSLGTGVE